MIGFVSTGHASNEIYLESGDTFSNTFNSPDDEHWYRIDTKQDNSDIAIYLTNTTAPVLFIVYDSKNEVITDGTYNNHTSLTSIFRPLKEGTYYIKVYPWGWDDNYSKGSYEISATYMSGDVVHNTTTFEPNDTRENAFPIQSNVPITSVISNEYDKDFYSITLNQDGNVNISLSNTSAPVLFTVYDSKKEIVTDGTFNGSHRVSSLSRALKAGTYYIQVHANAWDVQYSSGKYTLTASYPSASSQTNENEILLYLNSKKAFINGKSKTLAVAPFTKQDTTLVPLRFVSEELGAKVLWDQKKSEVTVLLDGTKIVLSTNSYYVSVNGSEKRLQVKPEIINGTTFVPLRFVSESLGKKVQFNAKNQSITIK